MRLFDDERDFTRWVLREARSRGWMAAHLGNVQIVRGKGGIPVAIPDKDAAGFPDVVMVHPQHGVVWTELKMPDRSGRLAKPSDAQLRWLFALRECGEHVYIWGPSDQFEIVEIQDGRPSSARLFDHVGP